MKIHMGYINLSFNKVFNAFLILIASSFFFRVPSTWLLILFVAFNLYHYKKLSFSRSKWLFIACISSPFILELLFFFKNNDLGSGIKSAEKTASLLLLPIFILGNLDKVQVHNLLKTYTYITTAIISALFIRFVHTSPKFFTVYLKGEELWEVGYSFADSFNMHAPALNMHLAFLAITCFYLFSISLLRKGMRRQAIFLSLFLVNFFYVLFVNTKLAVFNMFLGVVIVFFFQILTVYKPFKVVIIATAAFILCSLIFVVYLENNPYMKEKYLKVPFTHIDKIGRLDEVENPEAIIYSSLVTRISIWKSAYELSIRHLPFGVGSSDGKEKLNEYYLETNQKFLARNKFPAHNQFLDFTIKFGIMGFIVVAIYIFSIGYIGFTAKNSLNICLFIIFLSSNLVDDFLIRFDGIVFSGFWFSIFAANYLKNKKPFNSPRTVSSN